MLNLNLLTPEQLSALPPDILAMASAPDYRGEYLSRKVSQFENLLYELNQQSHLCIRDVRMPHPTNHRHSGITRKYLLGYTNLMKRITNIEENCFLDNLDSLLRKIDQYIIIVPNDTHAEIHRDEFNGHSFEKIKAISRLEINKISCWLISYSGDAYSHGPISSIKTLHYADLDELTNIAVISSDIVELINLVNADI